MRLDPVRYLFMRRGMCIIMNNTPIMTLEQCFPNVGTGLGKVFLASDTPIVKPGIGVK